MRERTFYQNWFRNMRGDVEVATFWWLMPRLYKAHRTRTWDRGKGVGEGGWLTKDKEWVKGGGLLKNDDFGMGITID